MEFETESLTIALVARTELRIWIDRYIKVANTASAPTISPIAPVASSMNTIKVHRGPLPSNQARVNRQFELTRHGRDVVHAMGEQIAGASALAATNPSRS